MSDQKSPEERAKQIICRMVENQSGDEYISNMTVQTTQNEITKAIREAEEAMKERCAKVAEECRDSHAENPAIDWFERSRRQGIRWCGELVASRIRSLGRDER